MIGSVRPGLTFCPAIFFQLQNNRPLAGFESGKGAMCSGSPEAQLPGGMYESTRDALEVAPQPFWDYWEGRRLVRVNLGLTETKQIAE